MLGGGREGGHSRAHSRMIGSSSLSIFSLTLSTKRDSLNEERLAWCERCLPRALVMPHWGREAGRGE